MGDGSSGYCRGIARVSGQMKVGHSINLLGVACIDQSSLIKFVDTLGFKRDASLQQF